MWRCAFVMVVVAVLAIGCGKGETVSKTANESTKAPTHADKTVKETSAAKAVAKVSVPAGTEGPAPQGSESAPLSGADGARIECQNNLKQLWACCRLYAAEHDGRYPDTVEALHPEYCPDQSRLQCPGARRVGAASAANGLMCDYDIFPGLMDKASPKKVLIQEKGEHNHTETGHNVLYVDGRVEFK